MKKEKFMPIVAKMAREAEELAEWMKHQSGSGRCECEKCRVKRWDSKLRLGCGVSVVAAFFIGWGLVALGDKPEKEPAPAPVPQAWNGWQTPTPTTEKVTSTSFSCYAAAQTGTSSICTGTIPGTNSTLVSVDEYRGLKVGESQRLDSFQDGTRLCATIFFTSKKEPMLLMEQTGNGVTGACHDVVWHSKGKWYGVLYEPVDEMQFTGYSEVDSKHNYVELVGTRDASNNIGEKK